MQYWINHNGVQTGPVELDALKEMGLTSSAYVWHEGLTDWVKITQLPELQGCYQMVGVPMSETRHVEVGQPIEPAQPVAVGQPLQSAAGCEAVDAEPSQQAMGPSQPESPQQWPQHQASGYQEPVQPQSPQEPCPPTNLAWAIISTVLCCLPAGVVAIIYAVKVTNKYNAGDIEEAKKASETGAWWCIASIILGLICQPFLSMITSMIRPM